MSVQARFLIVTVGLILIGVLIARADWSKLPQVLVVLALVGIAIAVLVRTGRTKK